MDRQRLFELNEQASRKIRMTRVSIFHYFRLGYRSLLFLTLLGFYISNRLLKSDRVIHIIERQPAAIAVVCTLFTVEMIFRFFPNPFESPGCQKQFARNYVKTGRTDIVIHDNNAVVLVLLVWICFNAALGALYITGIIDDDVMLLLSCAYSVCDMICILFFCPFQTWFLKNKCCSSCRIYNWDYAMMFTPLFFVAKPYTWSLLALSVALLVRWEITFYRHPERFSENTNDFLRCANCSEKLCSHKKQLKRLWAQLADFSSKRLKQLQK